MGRQHEREKIRELVSAYLDGELPPEDAAWVGRQISDDPQYAATYRAYRGIRMDMRALPVPDVPPSVSAAIRAYTATAPPMRPVITLRARIARITMAAATVAAAITAIFTHGFGLPPQIIPGYATGTNRAPISIPVSSRPTSASLANAKLAFGDRAQVIFSRQMDETTVKQDVHFAPVNDQSNVLAPSQLSYDPNTFTLSTLPLALKANTDYRVTIPKGLRDLQGNDVQSGSFDFSVGPPPPIIANAPTVVPTATTAAIDTPVPTIDTPAPTAVATAPQPTATPEPVTATDTTEPADQQPTAVPTAPRSAPTATTARLATATPVPAAPTATTAPAAPTQAATSVPATATTSTTTGATTSAATTAPTATTAAPSPTAAPKPTMVPSATATSAPTVTPTTAPTATPSTPVSPNFQGAYAQTANRLGAAVSVASPVSGTQLTFQSGVMIYVPGKPFYVVYPGGSWQSAANPGGSGLATPNPSGGFIPGGPYGAAWTNNKLSGKLGYATASQESSYTGSLQQFDNGVILQVGSDVYVFFDNGTYSHFGA